MARARVSAVALRKLDAIEQSLRAEPEARRGVMIAPPMLSLSDWEHAAQASQVELVRATQADIELGTVPALKHLRSRPEIAFIGRPPTAPAP